MLHRLADDPAKLMRIDRGLHIHTPAGLGVFELMLSLPASGICDGQPRASDKRRNDHHQHNTLFSTQGAAAEEEQLPPVPSPVVQQAAETPTLKKYPAPALQEQSRSLGAIWAGVLKLDKLDRGG